MNKVIKRIGLLILELLFCISIVGILNTQEVYAANIWAQNDNDWTNDVLLGGDITTSKTIYLNGNCSVKQQINIKNNSIVTIIGNGNCWIDQRFVDSYDASTGIDALPQTGESIFYVEEGSKLILWNLGTTGENWNTDKQGWAEARRRNAFIASNGNVELHNVFIQNYTCMGVQMYSGRGALYADNVTVQNCGGAGIAVETINNGNVTLNNVKVYNCGYAIAPFYNFKTNQWVSKGTGDYTGIDIKANGGSRTTYMENVTVENCGGQGIQFGFWDDDAYNNGKGIGQTATLTNVTVNGAKDNSAFSKHYSGICIFNGVNVTINNSHIYNAGVAGVEVHQGTITINNTELYNSNAGIHADRSAIVYTRGNTQIKNNGNGVSGNRNAQIHLEGLTTITNSSIDGVQVWGNTQLHIASTTIDGGNNANFGIAAYENAKTKLYNGVTIRNNKLGAIGLATNYSGEGSLDINNPITLSGKIEIYANGYNGNNKKQYIWTNSGVDTTSFTVNDNAPVNEKLLVQCTSSTEKNYITAKGNYTKYFSGNNIYECVAHEWLNNRGKYNDTTDYGTCYGEREHYKCSRCGANLGYGTDNRVYHTYSDKYEDNNGVTNGHFWQQCSNNIHTQNHKYRQLVYVRYQDSNGNWGSYSNVIDSYKTSGSNVSWSRNADTYYKAASLSYTTTTKAEAKYVSVYRQIYTLTLNKSTGVSSFTGGGNYYAGATATTVATASTGYHLTKYIGTKADGTANGEWTGCSEKSSHTDSWTMLCNRTITVYASRNNYTLDVNPIRDGVKNNNGFGTGYTFNVDVTDPIEGGSNNTAYDATNVTDYCQSIPYGCTYKVTITNNPTGYTSSHPINCNGTIGTSNVEATPTWTSTTHAFDVNRRITINGTNHDYGSSAGTDKTPSGISYDSFKFNMTRKNRYGTALDSTSNAIDYYNTAETYGTTYNITAANTPAGYTWNGNYSGTVTGYTSQWIQWTANSYTITFKQNKPTNMTPSITGRADNSTVTVVFDSTANNSVTTCNADPNGWVFNGWYTAQTGGTKVYNADGSYSSSATSYWTSSGTWKYTGNVTLYAQWIARQYTLYFNDSKPSNASHNVSLSPTSKVVTYDSKIGDVPTPTLKGWTLQKDSSGNHWFIGSTYINKDTIWNYTSSQTAYVSWKENEYSIYYEKGLTDDTTHQSIADATSNTNIQATGTSRPYTSAKYDNNVKIATIGSVLGRNYNVQFNSNKPASVTKQLTNNGANPTTVDNVTGNLPSRGTWQISGQDSDVTSNLTPAMGSTLTKPNYKDANNASLTATALWNNTNIKNFTDISMEGWTFLGWYDNPEGNDSKAENSTDNTTVVNTSTDKSANSNVKVYGNITEYTVKPYTAKFDKTLYARWQRTITLTLNLNGGMYQNQDAPIVLTGIYYNNADGYKFSLNGTLTPADLPDYEMQISSYKINGNQIGVDAYGTYDSNGVNNKYTKIDSNGATYRFLGWSTSPSATEPDSEYIVYKDNHKTSLRLYDSLNLYAVWEPVLTANVQVHRTLGDLTFSDGSTPKTSASGLHASDALQQLQVIAKPGEQCGYTIQTLGSNNIYVGVEFDTKITDLYDHQGTWTDNLNPPTEEKIVENQTHGLNRILKLENNSATRKFFIPQYLGTDKSYSSSIGVKVYSADILIQQDSYYYKGLGTKEEIPVHITIYLTTDKSGKPKPTPTSEDPNPKDPDPVISVLDELRTKLKIRLK